MTEINTRTLTRSNITTKSDRKDFSISLIRVIAILLVVTQHSTQLYFGNNSIINPSLASPWFNVITHYVASFSMPTFVFVSGYLYYLMRQEKNKYTDYENFIKSKAKRLLLPYYIFAFLYFLPVKLYLGLYAKATIYETLMTLTVAGGQNVLWFLFMLFWIFAIFYLIEDKLNKWNAAAVGLILVIISVYSGYFTTTLQVQTVFQYFLFFYIGYTTRKNILKLNNNIKKIFLLSIIGHTMLFSINNLTNQLAFFPMQQIVIIVTSTLGVFSIFGFAKILDSLFDISRVKSILYLDKNSFVIYLFHVPVQLMFLYYFAPNIKHYSIIAMLTFITGLAGSIILASIFSKSKFFRTIFYNEKVRKETLVTT